MDWAFNSRNLDWRKSQISDWPRVFLKMLAIQLYGAQEISSSGLHDWTTAKNKLCFSFPRSLWSLRYKIFKIVIKEIQAKFHRWLKFKGCLPQRLKSYIAWLDLKLLTEYRWRDLQNYFCASLPLGKERVVWHKQETLGRICDLNTSKKKNILFRGHWILPNI